ncbi:MAG: triple tyrosine motif-containing protein [Flavisolibacter sp.]
MRGWLLTTTLVLFFTGSAQNQPGLPEIFNYSKQDYSAGTQNWEIAQDTATGLMYFANNEGLLCFDGSSWKLYPLPNKTNVRSLALGKGGRIYVGGQGELGYFSADEQGRLVYRSLVSFIPLQDRSFADVWNIVLYKNAVFFQTTKRIFEYSAGKMVPYAASEWRFLGKAQNLLLAQDAKKGLLQYHSGFWTPFAAGKVLPGESIISSMAPLSGDSSIITTLKHGSYVLKENEVLPWKTPGLESISSYQPYATNAMDEQNLVVGTSANGCYVVNHHGDIVSSFSRREGLQNNNVLSAFTDKNRNIWLGLDNGIAFIPYNNAIRHLYPDAAKDVSGYASLVYNNWLYLGTSNGLFRTTWSWGDGAGGSNAVFEPVAHTGGQVWNLSEVNDLLLLGHHEGSFIVRGNEALPLDQSVGFWTFLPLSNVLPSSLMVAGNYNGVGFYSYENNSFRRVGDAGFESARFVLVDGKDVWVSHPYKGIFRVNNGAEKPKVLQYGKEKGIPSANNNYIFRIRNRILVSSDNGILEYQPEKDAFESSAFYNGLFGDLDIRYMKEDADGNIWFVFKKNLGVADFSGAEPRLVYLPELNNKMVSGFEHVYPADRHHVLVGGEKGFYLVDYDRYKQLNTGVKALVRSVSIFNKRDSLLYGGYAKASGKTKAPEVGYSWNNFHFEYSSTLFGQADNIEYSYKLDGFDKAWSEWTKKTAKEYTNLPAGNYTFQVKARNNLGNESEAAAYSFTIAPPWYQTPFAYGLYALLLLLAFYALYYYQKRKLRQQQEHHRKEQERLQYLHQLEIDKSDKQIVQLKNEKLENEIGFKNKELASVAMHLVQKGELLRKIREELVKMKNNENSKSTDSVKKLIRILQEEEKMDDDWEYFASHFDKVHSDFLLALKEHYPNLTSNELKLSAYLRMNLSTKEVAQLMNISVRGVEISRYRLRKKLGIPTEVNLFQFLMNFNGSNGKPPVTEASRAETEQAVSGVEGE